MFSAPSTASLMLNEMNETKKWDTRKIDYLERMRGAAAYIRNGKVVAAADTVKVLEAAIRPFDRVNIEGNNQKQADFLAECLKKCDTRRVHRSEEHTSELQSPKDLS